MSEDQCMLNCEQIACMAVNFYVKVFQCFCMPAIDSDSQKLMEHDRFLVCYQLLVVYFFVVLFRGSAWSDLFQMWPLFLFLGMSFSYHFVLNLKGIYVCSYIIISYLFHFFYLKKKTFFLAFKFEPLIQ